MLTKQSPFARISGKTVAQRLPDYVHILADCSPVAEGGPNCRVSLIARRSHEHTPIPTEMIEKASDFVHSQRLPPSLVFLFSEKLTTFSLTGASSSKLSLPAIFSPNSRAASAV